MASTQIMAMPVRFGPQNTNPRWIPLTHDVIQDLREALKESGLGSLFFKQPLKGIFGTYVLVPYDCKYIVTTFLTDSQYILWEVKWRRTLITL